MPRGTATPRSSDRYWVWRFFRTAEIPIIGPVAFHRREPDAASRDHKSRLTASRAQPKGHPPTGRGAGSGRGRLSLHQPDAYVARQNGWHLMGSDISRFAADFLGCRPNPKLKILTKAATTWRAALRGGRSALSLST